MWKEPENPSVILENFKNRWPYKNLKDLLKIETYVIGNDNKDSFCYWLERKTKALGNINGLQGSQQYEIYWNKFSNNYKWKALYSKYYYDEVFDLTKEKILDVIEVTLNRNFSEIDFIKLDALVKWKIAYLYQDFKKPGVFGIMTPGFWKYKYPNSNAPLSVKHKWLIDEYKIDSFSKSHELAVKLWSEFRNLK